jgi:hypothetical protein
MEKRSLWYEAERYKAIKESALQLSRNIRLTQMFLCYRDIAPFAIAPSD